MAGDTARAESLAEDVDKRFPLDTQTQSLWLRPIHAQLALEHKNPSAALNAMQAASVIEFGQIQFVINLSCLYPTYVRGEAYLAGGQGADADAARVRALTAYQDFLALWKNADPNVPNLKQAQAEYVKLQ